MRLLLGKQGQATCGDDMLCDMAEPPGVVRGRVGDGPPSFCSLHLGVAKVTNRPDDHGARQILAEA